MEQVQQVAIDHSYKLPNSQEVLEGFPSLWIEMYKNEGQIAGIAMNSDQ